MRYLWILLVLLVGCTEPQVTVELVETGGENMKITSNSFSHEGMIPPKYTCQGENINPELQWKDVPSNTKSLALIMDDPDAPGGTWVHWLVKDISVNVNEIAENSVVGNQVVNSFRKEDYGGPCPPSGVHRYFFKLYALDVESFEASSSSEFYEKVEQHKIAEAVLMGKYTKG